MYFTRTSGWHTARARRSRRGVRRPPRGGRGRRAAAPPPPARARRAARRPPCARDRRRPSGEPARAFEQTRRPPSAAAAARVRTERAQTRPCARAPHPPARRRRARRGGEREVEEALVRDAAQVVAPRAAQVGAARRPARRRIHAFKRCDRRRRRPREEDAAIVLAVVVAAVGRVARHEHVGRRRMAQQPRQRVAHDADIGVEEQDGAPRPQQQQHVQRFVVRNLQVLGVAVAAPPLAHVRRNSRVVEDARRRAVCRSAHAAHRARGRLVLAKDDGLRDGRRHRGCARAGAPTRQSPN